MTAFQRLAIGVVLACVAVPARADYIDHFASRTDVGRFKVPSQGRTRVLVIPVFVDDQPYSAGSEEAFVAEIEDFFAVDDRGVFDGGFRFTAYWEQASLGRYRPEAVVAAPVHFPSCPPLGEHEDCRIPRGGGVADGDLAGAAATLRDSLRFLDEIILCATAGTSPERRCTSGGGVDLADFDTSGQQPGVADGFVDGVLVVSNASFPGIALPVKDLSGQALLSFLGPLPSFTYGELTVPSVGIAGFATSPQRETFIAVHEFGHLLGFCDLYNEAGTTTDLPYTVMGGWYYDAPAVLPDAFSRLAIGWANVVDVSGGGSFRLENASRSGQMLKVGGGDEFFLIEHRAADTGIEGDLDVDSGVFIERVRLDRRPSGTAGSYLQTLQECVNCRPFDSMLTVEEADGAYDLQRNRPRNDAADLFQAGQGMAPSDDTDPRGAANLVFSTNLFSGEPTGLTITVDESDADGATITVAGPPKDDPCADLETLCLQDCVIDDDGHGRCGDFVTFPPPVPADEDEDAVGCTCAGTSGLMPLVPALLGLGWRRRRRRG
jgi:M6 family metalloprotease-like protein/uncharacterized protein (TIGR03382 family)